MIPQNGKPAPHNIMLGQWEPSWVEMELGIQDGYGAVSHLFWGAEECGISKSKNANLRTAIYEEAIEMFGVADTVHDWESNDCIANAREAFPNDGDWSTVPQFVAYTAADEAGNTISFDGACFGTAERTDYMIWKMDAFHDCLFDSYSANGN